MSGPVRVQLSRKRGWRMPENTVKVDRSTFWGNPFHGHGTVTSDPVSSFRRYLERGDPEVVEARFLAPLRGKNLACWCPLDQPCHADVLLEIANAPNLAEPSLADPPDGSASG